MNDNSSKYRYAYTMSHLFGSQTSLREANRSALLSYIRRFGAITQIELAEATGLSTATVSTLVRQLVKEGRLYTENRIGYIRVPFAPADQNISDLHRI